MITVRLMEESDLDRVTVLEGEIFSMPWSKQAFLDGLKNEKAIYLVAENAQEVVGYCGVYNILGEGDIVNVAVAKEYRGNGIALQMLRVLLQLGEKAGIEAFTLEVRAGNAPAIYVYEQLGFAVEGVRKNFYEKPTEDALIMWKR